MINAWFAGNLPERLGEFWSPTAMAEAGPGLVAGWGKYSNHSGLQEWCVHYNSRLTHFFLGIARNFATPDILYFYPGTPTQHNAGSKISPDTTSMT